MDISSPFGLVGDSFSTLDYESLILSIEVSDELADIDFRRFF
jgi:hypothetical protein